MLLLAMSTISMGCAERVLHPLSGCEGGNPVEVLSLGPHAYIQPRATFPAGDGWLVTVSTHDAHISELARTIDVVPQEVQAATLSRQTLWVEACQPPEVLAEDLEYIASTNRSGPWFGRDYSRVRSDVLFVYDEAMSAMVLPGTRGYLMTAWNGDIAGLDSAGTLYRWTPGTSPEDREVLEEGIRWIGENVGYNSPQLLTALREDDQLLTLDLATGSREVHLEDVESAVSLLGGRFLYAQQNRAPGRGGAPAVIIDRERHRSHLVSPDAMSLSRQFGDASRAWIKTKVVRNENESFPDYDIIVTHLPSLQQVRLPGTGWEFASFASHDEAYLRGPDATYRLDPETGELESIAPFPANVVILDPWIYFIRGGHLYRRLQDAPGDELDLIIDEANAPPEPLSDGRWMFFRTAEPAEHGALGDLFLRDPETGETTLLARNVSSTYSLMNENARPAPERRRVLSTDVLYTTIHPEGSILWHYRVPPR